MTPDKLLVIIISILGISFTYWYFLMKKDDAAVEADAGSIMISVKGGYTPSTIIIPKGKMTTLNFIRRDPSSCLEEIVIPDFKIRKYLPMDQETAISVNPDKEGTYQMSCGMNMFHATLIVK